MIKIAFIVSHPIQYYAPLHRRLAQREDVQIKVFFTWHGGSEAQLDPGFQKRFAWDMPLTDGYAFEVVPNVARDPGTHHFWGLRNPSLVEKVMLWAPDVVHITGYSYESHLCAMRKFARLGVPVMFRGDSHLLDGQGPKWRWQIKRALLSNIFSWPAAFLYVGQANREYYRAFGVPEAKLWYCPHSVDVDRFAEPELVLQSQAAEWRKEIVSDGSKVLLFVGKFENKKRPVPLMKAFLDCAPSGTILVMVGDGQDGEAVRKLAGAHPKTFRVLPFQNQSRMPVVYRLGDCVVLPSAHGETWGLAVNEALACGRPAIVSDRVGCQADVIRPGLCGEIFKADDWADFRSKLASMEFNIDDAHRQKIKAWAQNWSIEKTEEAIVNAALSLSSKRKR